ncbi:MAG: hypothetical protein EXS50_03020 [Candidatus Taylorbacteria bacterium]|nr:hypothetical protein [Candidatus Taylorbacteria bacterium]
MSKKNVYLIIFLVILLLGGLLYYFYSFLNSGSKIKQTTETSSPSKNLFPYGEGATGNGSRGNTGSTTSSYQTSSGPTSELRQISIVPIAGSLVFSVGSTTKVRYTERGTGHIYETTSDNLSQTRISNTTIPKIYEALWVRPDLFVIRYLDEGEANIISYVGSIIPTKRVATSTQFVDTIATTINGNFLSQNINSISASPKKDSILYFQQSSTGSTATISNSDGSKKNLVFNSSFKEWLPQWFKDDNVLLTSKASYESLGYSYILNLKTGSLTPAITKVRGLATLANPQGDRIMYSEGIQGGWKSNLYNSQTKKSEALLLKTFPEKCTWGKKITSDLYCANPTFSLNSAIYPDDWYKGKVHFSDDIWKLDTITGTLTQIAPLKKLTSQDIDVVNLSTDERDSYLIFTNKTDLTLWGLKIK